MLETFKLILIITVIALFLGTLIVVVSALLPKEKEKTGKAGQILKIVPKRDCGACGYPGCEKYAQAIAENPQLALKDRCPFMIKDEEKRKELEKILNLSLKKEKK